MLYTNTFLYITFIWNILAELLLILIIVALPQFSMQKIVLPTHWNRQWYEEGPERGQFKKQGREMMLCIARCKAEDEGNWRDSIIAQGLENQGF